MFFVLAYACGQYFYDNRKTQLVVFAEMAMQFATLVIYNYLPVKV